MGKDSYIKRLEKNSKEIDWKMNPIGSENRRLSKSDISSKSLKENLSFYRSNVNWKNGRNLIFTDSYILRIPTSEIFSKFCSSRSFSHMTYGLSQIIVGSSIGSVILSFSRREQRLSHKYQMWLCQLACV